MPPPPAPPATQQPPFQMHIDLSGLAAAFPPGQPHLLSASTAPSSRRTSVDTHTTVLSSASSANTLSMAGAAEFQWNMGSRERSFSTTSSLLSESTSASASAPQPGQQQFNVFDLGGDGLLSARAHGGMVRSMPFDEDQLTETTEK
ncbi:hypothetical protein HK101_003994, partial [Irineochytrium annulatum]